LGSEEDDDDKSSDSDAATRNTEKKAVKIERPKEEDHDDDEESSMAKQKEMLEGEDYDALRKRLRERKKALQANPHFALKKVGLDASLDLPEEMRRPLYVSDLQHMILYALMGTRAPVEPVRWCRFTQWSKLRNVLLLAVDGIGLREHEDWSRTQASRHARFSRLFEHRLHFVSPASYGSDVAEDLCILPLSQSGLGKIRSRYGNIQMALNAGSGDYFKVFRSAFPIAEKTAANKNDKTAITQPSLRTRLLLTLDQMVHSGYPVPFKGESHNKSYEGYVGTSERYEPVTETSPMFSIDCEMVQTAKCVHELAKICVMDSDFKVLFTSYVKPDQPVTNYLTKFSGITPQILSGIRTTLKDVQERLKEILPPDAILVGHSLNSDLNALKMFHPYVIDTSVIYCLTHSRLRKSKLKDLAKIFLGKDIQTDDAEHGHDPEEDARAAMELVHLKLEKGYEFGDVLMGSDINNDAAVPSDQVGKIATSTLKTITDADRNITVIGHASQLQKYEGFAKTKKKGEENDSSSKNKAAASEKDAEKVTDCSNGTEAKDPTFHMVENNKQAVSKALESLESNHLTICHLAFSDQDMQLEPKKEGEEDNNDAGMTCKAAKTVRKATKKLWSQMPKNSLLVSVWSGGNTSNSPASGGSTSSNPAFVGININKADIQL